MLLYLFGFGWWLIPYCIGFILVLNALSRR